MGSPVAWLEMLLKIAAAVLLGKKTIRGNDDSGVDINRRR